MNKEAEQLSWQGEFDEMWYDPQSTIMNWEGLFRKQSWRDGDRNIEDSLKKDLAEVMVKPFIKDLLQKQREEVYKEVNRKVNILEKINRKKKMENGICTMCTKVVSLTNKQYCEYHRQKHIDYKKKSRERAKERKI